MSDSPAQRKWLSFSHSLTLRTLLIGLLIVLMMIPLFMVEDVVQERNQYRHQVLNDIASSWGGRQTLTGPILIIPYVEHLTSVDTITDSNGESKVITKDTYNDHTAVILPEQLEIRADIKEERRQRGIYDALIYTAKLNIKGNFDYEYLLEAEEGDRRILWEKTKLVYGLTDTRAIGTDTRFQWNGDEMALQPGSNLPELLTNGFHIPLDNETSNATAHDFELDLSLRGSDGLYFAPLGRSNDIRITSSWQHPSFQGDILPDERDIGELGFKASWRIPNLARSYPQHWLLADKAGYDPQYFTAGVSLYEPVSLYSQIERAVKYGILFIVLTFVTFFAFEISSGQRLHVLQYGLIGFAMALFYLILLSLAEHMVFMEAYIIAAAATVTIIWIYAWAVMRSFWKGLFILTVLGGLYYLLFIILQLEDYALLAGTGLLGVAMLMLMLATARINSSREH